MDFYKYHALGNDYIVIDPSKNKVGLTEANIRRICHRNFGIGSDGILYGPTFDGEAISLKILNPDGSEAEKSGNCIRIFSKYLFDESYIEGNRFRLRNARRKRSLSRILDDQARQIKVDMGSVTFISDEIPVSGEKREVVDEIPESGRAGVQDDVRFRRQSALRHSAAGNLEGIGAGTWASRWRITRCFRTKLTFNCCKSSIGETSVSRFGSGAPDTPWRRGAAGAPRRAPHTSWDTWRVN